MLHLLDLQFFMYILPLTQTSATLRAYNPTSNSTYANGQSESAIPRTDGV